MRVCGCAAYASVGLVRARLAEGQAAKAVAHAERAFELAKQDGDYGRVAESLEVLAAVKAASGETAKAAELLDDAIAIGEENPARPPSVETLLQRAALAEGAAALPHLAQARRAAEAMESPLVLARVLRSVAHAHTSVGAVEKAATALREALQLAEGDAELAAALQSELASATPS